MRRRAGEWPFSNGVHSISSKSVSRKHDFALGKLKLIFVQGKSLVPQSPESLLQLAVMFSLIHAIHHDVICMAPSKHSPPGSVTSVTENPVG
ncbi:hypothetical protein GOODEAATRI_027831 [Goodea atripinnis]|uniref:Uncharacterized protein n=1 Tax=Goodea atripinnis TaxID=208336 RepID=A0ABV0NNS9_9TELE